MKYNQTSLDQTLRHINEFHDSTGFQLSYEKTTIYRFGSLQKSDAKLYTANNIKWTSDRINVLGIEICADQDQLLTINYDTVFKKCESVLSLWKKRKLSLCGKIEIINTLIGSMFVYKMLVLPRIPDSYLTRFNKLVEQFIWNGSRPKIRTDILQLHPRDGGMGLVDLSRKDDSLKASWVQMIFNGQYPEKIPHECLHDRIGPMLWSCNLAKEDVELCVGNKNRFWKDVVKAWCKYHYTPDPRQNQIIWLNSEIRINGRPVYWSKPAAMGLMYVSDIVSKEAEVARQEYGLSVMQWNSLISAIPNTLKEVSVNQPHFSDPKFYEYMDTEKATKFIYRELSPRSHQQIKKIEEKWEVKLGTEVSVSEQVTHIKMATVMAKYRSFQYRLVMMAVVTNVQLKRWGLTESEMCSFCHEAPETYIHLFCECSCLKVLEKTT